MWSRRIKCHGLAFSILLLVASGSGRVARADEIGYEQLVRDALSEFRAGRYLESHALFQQAHELKPSARTLRGMGQAAFGAKSYAQAIVDLTAALASDTNPLTPKMQREAEATIARARNYTGRFRVTLDPPDAELTVDGGRPVYDADGALLLDVGLRQVAVRAPGRADRESTLQVAGGEERPLSLSVSLAATPTDRDPLAGVDTSTPPDLRERQLEPTRPLPEPKEVERPFPWLALGAFGLSAAGIAGGIASLQLRNSHISSWNAHNCPADPDTPDCHFWRDGWETATTWEIISFGLAGAFAATGVLLLVIHGNSDTESETAITCGPSGLVGVSCQMRM
jgi:hypothetical protein